VSELLGADTDLLDRYASSLSSEAGRVQDIRLEAQRAVSELQGCWQGSDLIHLLQQWEQQTSPLLASASAALDTCAVQLRSQSTAQRVTSQDGGSPQGRAYDGVNGLAPLLPLPVTSPVPPPRHGSPADSATWWRSLNPQRQQQVITLHPAWIGSRDGVSFAARDQANRSLMSVDRERLEAERRRLEPLLVGDWSGDMAHSGAAALNRVKDQLASIRAVTATLDVPGKRQLLLFDLGPERAEAAIANGDVDTADNVAVFVPGLRANVAEYMQGYDARMSELRARAESESRNARAGTSAATVTWIGYQAPQLGLGLVTANSVAGSHAAAKGAEKLVPFLQGVNAARSRDAHLTLLGHSYGSTTAAMALRQNTGVDDAVFFGSPGLATDKASELKLSGGGGAASANATPSGGGHLSYIEAQNDFVGDLGRFGPDPSQLAGLEHPSALESTVVDPLTGKVRHFDGVTGHEAYLAEGSTSQYNIALAVAGLPDREVRSDGLDVGDVLGLAARNLLPPSWGVSVVAQLESGR
jgi:uncharacterized protein YukE